MSWILSCCILCLYLAACCMVRAASRDTVRHTLYWNTFMTPELKTSDFVKHVKIGDFMDILCPHRSLVGITNGPHEPAIFNLYNVSETDYLECKSGGNRNIIFACDRPNRENKLTMKFQTFTPSPLGFRFQYCADYYLVAIPRSRRTQTGCHKESTRLKISVACKETTTTTTTTTTKSTTTESKVVAKRRHRDDDYDRIATDKVDGERRRDDSTSDDSSTRDDDKQKAVAAASHAASPPADSGAAPRPPAALFRCALTATIAAALVTTIVAS